MYNFYNRVAASYTDQSWMWLAERVAQDSPALDKKVGAVIVNRFNELVVHGRNYDLVNPFGPTVDLNGCNKVSLIHAEQDAIAKLIRYNIRELEGLQLYVTLSPCPTCCNLIAASGIKAVYYKEPYKDSSGLATLDALGVYVRQVL